MKLFYYQFDTGIINFGDDLNPWLWDKFLPNIFDQDDSSIFVGMGTILNDAIPTAKKTAVFGSGYGYRSAPLIDESWKIYCVRGPYTANSLNLCPKKHVISDPALLVNRKFDFDIEKKHPISYMPHVSSAMDEWKIVCDDLNIFFIDPRQSVESTLKDIASTELLITEAMHGAIVADALRTPWVPVTTQQMINQIKWQDYCSSVSLEYQPMNISPLWTPINSLTGKLKAGARKTIVKSQLKKVIKNGNPILIQQNILTSKLDQFEEKLFEFENDCKSGFFAN